MTISARRGFTLIELLVVVAIITVLLAMTLTVTRTVRESANRATCAGRLKQLGMSVFAYGDDNRGLLPNGGSWNGAAVGNWGSTSTAYLAMVGYLDRDRSLNDTAWRKRFFLCPSSRAAQKANSTQITYSFYPGTPVDHNFTLLRVLASARANATRNNRPLASNQIPLFGDNTWLFFPGNSSGGFSTNCNHKRSSSVVYVTSQVDGGTPAGANVALSDGAVVWAEFGGPGPYQAVTREKTMMVVNGGSIGNTLTIPSNFTWFRLDRDGLLDNSRGPFNDNYIAANINLTFQASF